MLALNMRTNRVPLLKTDPFKNMSFNIWMAGIIVFLTLAVNVDFVRHYLKLVPIELNYILLSLVVITIVVPWREIRKHIITSFIYPKST